MTVEVMGIGASGMAKYQLKEIGNSYSITKPPTQGSATVSDTGLVTYTPLQSHFPTSATDTIGIEITDGGVSTTTTTTLTVKLQYDPLLPFQWHIQNTGQSAFASTSGSAGNDVNAAGAWAAGITGKDVLVNVVDTGLEIGHEDLKAQVLPGGSYNFLDGTNDPTATQADAKNGDHGTSVAGIIAATAFNGVGGRGIAYGAKLIG
ncbi:MAG: peptidase S8, partial [Betaproteobacteria bacterium]|nr:peptidase S8 [Betaproteobacteria bacterium]